MSGTVTTRGQEFPAIEPRPCDCGHPSTPRGLAAGYATAPDGRTLCYPCADSAQAAEMATADRFDAYLSGDGRNVTTWTGGVLARVTWASPERIRYTPTGGRYGTVYVTARDADGRTWHGRGPGAGMYVRLRRAAR